MTRQNTIGIPEFLLLALLATATTAFPAQIRFLEEFKFENATSTFSQVSADRYFLVGYPFFGKDNERLAVRYYNIFDVTSRRIDLISIPLTNLRKRYSSVFKKTEMPTLVHYDGQVSVFQMDERPQYMATSRYLCRYDHKTGSFAVPIRAGGMTSRCFTGYIGFDPRDKYVYFAVSTNEDGTNVLKVGATAVRLARIRLDTWTVDWQTTLRPFHGGRNFGVGGFVFNADGTKLAFTESEGSGTKASIRVIDFGRDASITEYPYPRGLFGYAFTRDARYLICSSRDSATISRIDLAAKKIDTVAASTVKIHWLFMTPSGKSVFTYVSETAMQVWSIDGLKPKVTIPTSTLFPGIERIFAPDEMRQTADGRFLLTPIYELSSFPNDKGFRLYAVDDDIDSAGSPGAASVEIQADKLFNTALRFARDNAIRFTTYHTKGVGDPTEVFAPAVITKSGDVLLGGTRNVASDDLTNPRTSPVAARIDSAGKARWQRDLSKPGFLDYEVASVASTPDDGCVARVVSMVDPGQGAIERLVKLDSQGTVQWDLRFRGTGSGIDTPFVDFADLLPDGSVSLAGRIYPGVGIEKKWRAVINTAGQVVSEKVE